MDIQQLVKEARLANQAAQRSLYEYFAPKMNIICRRYVKNSEDAEELMLNGFFKCFKNLKSFNYQGEASMLAWLKKIMINECLMFMRKKHLFVIVPEQHAENVDWSEDALNNLSAGEIFNLIVQLPPGYRTVFNLYAVEGMTHKEIAQLLGISEGTSKSQLSKAKTMLQKMITQNESHDTAKQSK